MMNKIQITQNNCKIKSSLSGFAARGLNFKKKRTRNSHFPRPRETDPYGSLAQRKSFQPAFDLRFQLLPVEESFLTLTPFLKENYEFSVEIHNNIATPLIPGLTQGRFG